MAKVFPWSDGGLDRIGAGMGKKLPVSCMVLVKCAAGGCDQRSKLAMFVFCYVEPTPHYALEDYVYLYEVIPAALSSAARLKSNLSPD